MESSPPLPVKKSSSRGVVVVLAVVAIGAIGAFVRVRSKGGFGASGAPSASASAERIVPVQVATVVARDVPIVVEGLGSVTAFNTVNIKTQVDGRIDKIAFVEGQTVKKGDLLAQIDPRPFAVQVQLAVAQLARDKAILTGDKIILERDELLVKQGVGASSAVDDQRAVVAKDGAVIDTDQANIDSAKLQLEFSRILSPIEGVVGVRQVDVGNVVHAADVGPLVIVTQINPIAVLISLPEDDLARVTKAMAGAKVAVDAYSRDGDTKIATGELLVLDNQINAGTATLRLKAIFPNDERKLWPNQFVKARIALSVRKDAIVVPSTVVQRGAQGPYAYVVGEGDVVSLRPVEVELTQGDVSVISHGLTVGEKVVVDGQSQLRPGAKVAPKTAEPGKDKDKDKDRDKDLSPAKDAKAVVADESPARSPAPSASASARKRSTL